MTYSGRYIPSNREKYKGNPLKIIYRSMWERRLMDYCDKTKKVIEWGSEEIAIPYISPIDGKIHRYFPDFYIKVRDNGGKAKKYIIEIKPKKQCIEPKIQKRRTKRYIREVMEYAKNQAKWKAAREYCADRNSEFKILTEDNLPV